MTGQRLTLAFLVASGLLMLAWLAPGPAPLVPDVLPDAPRLCDRPPPSGVDLVALGDSITAGYDGRPGSPAGVAWLDSAGCGDRPLVGAVNAGVSGETTAQLRRRVAADVVRRRPAMCVVLGGTNDLLSDRPLADTLADLTAIVDALEEGGVVPVLATVPPVLDRVDQVRRLNAAVEALARTEDLALVDFHAALADEAGRFRPGFTYDGVHPNAEGARAMAVVATRVLGEVRAPAG